MVEALQHVELISSLPLRYVDAPSCQVCLSVDRGERDGWVKVIGHPDHGSCEFLVLLPMDFVQSVPWSERRVAFSDQGYGSQIAALRDGLSVLLGDELPGVVFGRVGIYVERKEVARG